MSQIKDSIKYLIDKYVRDMEELDRDLQEAGVGNGFRVGKLNALNDVVEELKIIMEIEE